MEDPVFPRLTYDILKEIYRGGRPALERVAVRLGMTPQAIARGIWVIARVDATGRGAWAAAALNSAATSGGAGAAGAGAGAGAAALGALGIGAVVTLGGVLLVLGTGIGIYLGNQRRRAKPPEPPAASATETPSARTSAGPRAPLTPGAMRITVEDKATKERVSGATVVVTFPGQNLGQRSGKTVDGRITFPTVPGGAGKYDVYALKAGCAVARQQVELPFEASLDVVLQLDRCGAQPPGPPVAFSASCNVTEAVAGAGCKEGAAVRSIPVVVTLSGSFADGTVRGTVVGQGTDMCTGRCWSTQDETRDIDNARAEFSASYNASFETKIDPLSGEFSVAIQPSGTLASKLVELWKVDPCTRMNASPTSSDPLSGQGTLSGTVDRSGHVVLRTKWTSLLGTAVGEGSCPATLQPK